MVKNIKSVPNLRFKEFDGDWKITKLGKVFSIFNGYAFSSNSSLDKGALWVKIADVGVQKMKKDSLSYLPEYYLEEHKKFILKENDYVIALTRPILNGKLKLARINNFFNNSLLNQRVGKIVSENNHSFIYYLLQRESLIKLIENNIAGSDPPNLSPKEIDNIKTYIPIDINEQVKISSFFEKIDYKIELLENKKEWLLEYKKNISHKLFDYNSTEIKNLRKGKLKDFGYFYYGKGIPKTSVEINGLTPCVRYGELYSTYKTIIKEIVSYTNLNIDELKISTGGEILIPRVGEDPMDFANCCYLPLKNVAIGEMISVYNTNENGLFMTYYINTMLRKQIAKVVEGGNVSNLYFRYLEEIDIIIPNIEEQEKIANFLTLIDDKINHVTNMLEKTSEFKKGLLQQMFV